MSTQLPLAKWLNKELSELLECEVGEEYSKYTKKSTNNKISPWFQDNIINKETF